MKNVKVRDWDIAPLIPILSNVGAFIFTGEGNKFLIQGSFEKNGVIVARDEDLAKSALKILNEVGTK